MRTSKPATHCRSHTIPVGTMIHNVELQPGKGAQLVRSAGNAAQLMAKEGAYAQVRLPSGEVQTRFLSASESDDRPGRQHRFTKTSTSVRREANVIWAVRPTVRGSVMNPNDHPHGGGEGKSPIGPSGLPLPRGASLLCGYKTTRKAENINDKFIVRRRDGK